MTLRKKWYIASIVIAINTCCEFTEYTQIDTFTISLVFSAKIIIFLYVFLWQIHCCVFLWQPPICVITISPTYFSILSELLAIHVNSNLLSQSLLKLAFGKFFTIYLHLSFHCCWPFVILRTLLTSFLLFCYIQSILRFLNKKK